MKEIKGKITIPSLTILKEKKIDIIRAIKNQREKNISLTLWKPRMKTANPSSKTEISFLDEKIPQHQRRNLNDFGGFWRILKEGIWRILIEKVHQEDGQTAMEQHIEQSSEDRIQITKEMVFERVKKKQNCSLAGEDKITNYWIKRMNVFHQDIATALNVIIKSRLETPSWLHRGEVLWFQKKGSPLASVYSPVTCLSTLN